MDGPGNVGTGIARHLLTVCPPLIMLSKVFVLIFLVESSLSQDDCTDRPLPNRPFYQPNPTYQLISQIIPSGQPWPANVGDYSGFSQTQYPPSYTPVWATNRPLNPPTPAATRPPAPLAIVDILRPTTTPVDLEDRFGENAEYGWFWPEPKDEEPVRRTTATTTTPRSSTSMLFTSAPAVLNVRIDEDEPKPANVKPVNLIPDKFMVTMKPPRGSSAPVSATVKMPTRKPSRAVEAVPTQFDAFFTK